jgi:ubiquitin conjugation factor E4 A
MEGASGGPDLAANPFASLFPTVEVAHAYCSSGGSQAASAATEVVIRADVANSKEALTDDKVTEIQELNGVIEEVFLVTLNKFSVVGGEQAQLVLLAGMAEILGPHRQQWIDLPTLEQALFERVLLERPEEHVVRAPGCKARGPAHLTEARAVVYLAGCYGRLLAAGRGREGSRLADSLDRARAVVVQTLATALREPALYVGQDLPAQLAQLLLGSYEVCTGPCMT